MEHEGVLREIVDWAGADETVRAVVLTGSAAPWARATWTRLSDLDVEV